MGKRNLQDPGENPDAGINADPEEDHSEEGDGGIVSMVTFDPEDNVARRIAEDAGEITNQNDEGNGES